MNAEIIKQAAEKEIACHPDQKNIQFKIDDHIFWIKRKYSNKRNRLVKQSPETEFLFEVARIAIAAKAHPELVPQIEVLTSEYMVTRDGGPTIEDWMEDPDFTFEEKKNLLYRIGASLAALHNAGASTAVLRRGISCAAPAEKLRFSTGKAGTTAAGKKRRKYKISFFFSTESAE